LMLPSFVAAVTSRHFEIAIEKSHRE